MLDRLEPFLAVLREADIENAVQDWVRPTGPLATPSTLGVRYSSIPPEAIPLLDLGVDGCHYAAWVDDLGTLCASPGVVFVSPMDGYPDAIQWVAPSTEAFADLLRGGEPLPGRDDAEDHAQARAALNQRTGRISASTLDGLGVVESRTSAEREGQAAHDLEGLRDQVSALMNSGQRATALVFVRDAIATGAHGGPRFAEWVAGIYVALGRPEYGAVALRSYS